MRRKTSTEAWPRVLRLANYKEPRGLSSPGLLWSEWRDSNSRPCRAGDGRAARRMAPLAPGCAGTARGCRGGRGSFVSRIIKSPGTVGPGAPLVRVARLELAALPRRRRQGRAANGPTRSRLRRNRSGMPRRPRALRLANYKEPRGLLSPGLLWSEWRDSNSRPPAPKAGTLPTGLHPVAKKSRFVSALRHAVDYSRLRSGWQEKQKRVPYEGGTGRHRAARSRRLQDRRDNDIIPR